jgi:DNA-binding SARP family transcriptional activator/tetratricopeptide (TPR) repeat protein
VTSTALEHADATRSHTAALRLLGEPRLVAASGAASALERKDAALLAYLALEGRASRARLAALLWPDVDAEAARNSLRQRLHRLRKRAGADVVVGERDTLTLAIAHDLHAPAPLDAPAEELLGTLDYADCAALQAWLAAARTRRRQARRHALQEAAQRCERDGQIAAALRLAERLVADDGLAEDAHRRLMRLHLARGDRAAALAAFERCRATLAAQAGTAPGSETLALARQIEADAAAAGAPAKPMPVGVLMPPRLVGRDREWRELERARDSGRIALVTGEAGVGKTRLLSDFVRAERGLLVGARPGDAQIPYATIARLLRALAPRVAPPLEAWVRRELARLAPSFDAQWTPVGDIDAVRLAQAVQRLLAAVQGEAGTVALDDLQYADADTLRMLPLAMRADALATRWLLGARAHELPEAARAWLDGLGGETLARLELAPLAAPGVQALLESLVLPDFEVARWARTIHRRTGGNPMFILETLRALLAPGAARISPRALPLPVNVGQLIGARLTRLSAAALALAHVAALAGEDFDAALAAAVLRAHPLDLAAPWSELQRAQVLHEDRFAHDLVLEATRRSVAPEAAAALHRSIAAHLQARAPARAAAHWEAAREWRAACDGYVAAARQAGAASRRAEELALLRSAAACLQRSGSDEGRYEIELRSARAALLVDRTDLARQCAEAALACAVTPAERVEALAACAEAVDFLGQGERAIEYARSGLQLAVEQGNATSVLTLAGTLGRLYGARGECERGLAVFDQYAAWLTDEGSHAGCMFLAQRSQVLEQATRRAEAAAVARQALAQAVAAGNLTGACIAHTHLAAYCVRLGLKDETREHVIAALALREELGATGGQTEMARVYLGVWSYQTGRYRQAIEHFRTAHERLMLGHATPWAIVAQVALARVYITLGQPARGLQLLAAVPDGLPLAVRGLVLVATARALARLGRPHAHLLTEALAIYPQHRQFDNDLMARLHQVFDLAPTAGAELAAQVEADARARNNRPLMLDAQAAGCHCLLRAGCVEQAAHLARIALATAAQSIPWTVYPGEIYLCASEAFYAAGAHDEAIESLRSGVAWIEQDALPNVPPEFRDSFVYRNAANRALLTAASRRLR